MTRIRSKKLAIILGILLSLFDFIGFGYALVLCTFTDRYAFCTDLSSIEFLHAPTYQILSFCTSFISDTDISLILLVISGILQYFFIGYAIGIFILYTQLKYKKMRRRLRHH